MCPLSGVTPGNVVEKLGYAMSDKDFIFIFPWRCALIVREISRRKKKTSLIYSCFVEEPKGSLNF